MRFCVFLVPALACGAVDYTRDVAPLLRKNCSGCHGAQLAQNGLRVDSAGALLKGSYSGPVVVPGSAAGSKIVAMVTSGKMPPTPKKLDAAAVAVLREWIESGAPVPREASSAATPKKSNHWAFQPLAKPVVPAAGHPIDAFVRARLLRERIAPSHEAGKPALLRRVSLDLTGLPPTPAEIDAFTADTAPGAYDRLVDRLLNSPHYGEKWGRHWLDQARYADSDGYESDLGRPYAWRYRQYVIDALNRDLPFDQFTIEQLAGDLLPRPTPDQRAAVGFYRNSPTNREGGVDTEEFRIAQVLDRTAALGTVWLGLSIGCAQCHDHKYDPTTQREFYQLFAFFNPLMDHDVESPIPGEIGAALAARPTYEASRKALFESYGGPALFAEWRRILLKAADQPGHNDRFQFAWKYVGNIGNGLQPVLRLEEAQRPREQQEQLVDYFIDRAADVFDKKDLDRRDWDTLKKKWTALKAAQPRLAMAQSVRESFTPRKSHVLLRGDFRSPGVEVARATPAFLPPLTGEPSRLNLARWLVSAANPLTPRVIVNRVWQEYFGRGIVFTSEDFGLKGERPSHPELLDWLASDFIASGWRMKALHRRIVTSATYKQSSRTREELVDRDPDNVLLARQARLRLPAELIRDNALAASGLLNPAIGGPSIRPPQPKGVAELGYAGGVKWPESTGPDRYRRGLYVFFQRTTPYPQLMNFDAPESILACSRRQRSNTPLQALNLLNDPVFFEAAQALGRRLATEAPPSFGERLRHGFRLALAREPKAREVETLARNFDREFTALRQAPEEARYLYPHAWTAEGAAEGGAWTLIGRVLLNLDEFLHRE